MPFKKPYRICNKTVLAMPDHSSAVTATLKELKDRYELRLWIPGSKRHNYTVVIAEGTLYVYESGEPALNPSEIYGSFMLPANVRQDKVTALLRNYGLKIIMPLAPANGIMIRVPVLKEGISIPGKTDVLWNKKKQGAGKLKHGSADISGLIETRKT